MSGPLSALAHHIASPPPARRVRHEVRDGLAVMAFSLICSVLLALAFLAVMLVVGNQGA